MKDHSKVCLTLQDKCGEGKEGSGLARFNTAKFCGEKLQEMKKLLRENRAAIMGKKISLEVEARSVALQVTVYVLDGPSSELYTYMC